MWWIHWRATGKQVWSSLCSHLQSISDIKMKLSVLLLSILLALSAARLQDIMKTCPQHRNVSLLNPELEGRVPKQTCVVVSGPLTPADLEQQQDLLSSFLFSDNDNLEWLTWDGALPNGAVSIYNGYTSRTDYVCKYTCEAGFYNPNLGPYCHYSWADKEYYASEFQILTNKDNFELLEWKDGSYGSVPQHSVRTCTEAEVYVGKNKYGLGKVVPKFKAFFLPWEGKEYWYKYYQVLTINRDAYTQDIIDVKYAIDKANILQNPPETIHSSSVTNNACQTIVKKATLSEKTEVQHTWNIGQSTTLGITSSITAEIPLIGSGGIELSTEVTLQFSRGTTVVESHTYTESVEVKVPPNHFCKVHMEGRKIKADIPYTARLSRTYRNGDTHWTSVTGTYVGVKVEEIQAVVDRCEPVPNPQPCP